MTGVRRWKVKVPWKRQVDLVRLRNPWGDEVTKLTKEKRKE